jgi:hypothetical protein
VIDYLMSKFGEALGMGFIGLAVPILFRKSLPLSVLSGVFTLGLLAALNIYMGAVGGQAEDHVILVAISGLLGAGAGWFWNAGYRRGKQA